MKMGLSEFLFRTKSIGVRMNYRAKHSGHGHSKFSELK